MRTRIVAAVALVAVLLPFARVSPRRHALPKRCTQYKVAGNLAVRGEQQLRQRR